MTLRLAVSLALALSALTGAAHAQSSTGVSGVSGGIGSDFAASNVSGANTKSDGGLAASLDSAFGDDVNKADNKK